MAIKNGDVPIKNGGSFHSYVSLTEGNMLVFPPPGASMVTFSALFPGLGGICKNRAGQNTRF